MAKIKTNRTQTQTNVITHKLPSLSYTLFCFQPGVVCTYCYDPRDDTGVLKDTCEHTPGATCETHVDILMKGKIGH